MVGQEASVEALIYDIWAEFVGRRYELARVAGGWMFYTRTQFAGSPWENGYCESFNTRFRDFAEWGGTLQPIGSADPD